MSHESDTRELDRQFGYAEPGIFKGREPALEVKVFRVNPYATIPKYAHEGDSGMDLVTPIDLKVHPGVPCFVDIGIAVALPDGYEFQIRSRSGLTKRGLTACSGLGTVDSGYRSTIGVVLLWHAAPDVSSSSNWEFPAGSRIAQMVLQRVPRVQWMHVVSFDELGETERQAGGHGSTGLL